MPRRGKRQLNVWLSPDALDGWRAMCDQAGVESLTAMVEAVGIVVHRLTEPTEEWPAAWAQLVAEAKAIEAQRRSRTGGKTTGKSGDE